MINDQLTASMLLVVISRLSGPALSLFLLGH
jgi:hypothetical protein